MKQKIRKKEKENGEGHNEPSSPETIGITGQPGRSASQGLRAFIHMGYGQVRFKRWVCFFWLRNPNPTFQYILPTTASTTLGQFFLIKTSDKNDTHFPIRNICIDKPILWKIP